MTLIAAVGLDTYPVVFGDLPVPGPEQPGSVPDIPSVVASENSIRRRDGGKRIRT